MDVIVMCIVSILYFRSSTPLAQNAVSWARAQCQDMWLSVSGVRSVKPIRSARRRTNTNAQSNLKQLVESVQQSFATFAASNTQGHNIGVIGRKCTTQKL